MITVPRDFSAPRPRFVAGQAMYTPTGLKVGWVMSITDNVPHVGSQSAVIKKMDGSLQQYSTAALEMGILLNKNDLRHRNIARTSPVTVYPGSRLFNGTMFTGCVTKI